MPDSSKISVPRANELPPGLNLRPETPLRHAEAIEALFDQTFGPGHFAKTAERLREFNVTLPGINRVIVTEKNELIAVCRVWPIWIEEGGASLFFGPVAVHHAFRGSRLGLTATRAAMDAAAERGCQIGILIGFPPYFGEIGFESVPDRFSFPGPQDQARVLAASLCKQPSVMHRYHGRITAGPSAIRQFIPSGE